MRSFQDPIVFTNLLFFINSAIWYNFQEYMASFCMFIAFIFSFIYHMFGEKNPAAKFFDCLTAGIALVVTLITAIPYLNISGFVLLSVIASLSLTFLSKKEAHEYEGWHTAWHMSVFVGQLILALSKQSTLL